MLARAPARPSDRAILLAKVMGVFSLLILLLAPVLGVSYSIWSILQHVLFSVYAFFVLRPIIRSSAGAVEDGSSSTENSSGESGLVYIENVLCFALMCGFNALLSVLNLVNVATGKQAFSDNLKHWQTVCGIVTCSLSVACFVAITLLGVLLYRDVKTTVLETVPPGGDLEENQPFFPNGVFGAPDDGGFSPATEARQPQGFGYPATGSYASGSQTQTISRSSQRDQRVKTKKAKFPGKGYKLTDEDDTPAA